MLLTSARTASSLASMASMACCDACALACASCAAALYWNSSDLMPDSTAARMWSCAPYCMGEDANEVFTVCAPYCMGENDNDIDEPDAAASRPGIKGMKSVEAVDMIFLLFRFIIDLWLCACEFELLIFLFYGVHVQFEEGL